MSYAPAPLLEARTLILYTLPAMDPRSVGIVGDDSHKATGSSYHLGKDALRSDSYSIVESSRDRNGLTDAASALDLGWFSITVRGKVHNLRSYSIWLVAQCKAGTADTADIREVIYSPDGTAVKRWDRLGKRSTGDTSHRTHTHHSYFRDSEHRDKTGLFRRYFTEIGLLEDDDMDLSDKVGSKAYTGRTVGNVLNDLEGLRDTLIGDTAGTKAAAIKAGSPVGRLMALPGQLDTIGKALLAAIAAKQGVDVDEDAIAAGVLAGLTPERIAAAIPEALAQEVVDLLAARMQA